MWRLLALIFVCGVYGVVDAAQCTALSSNKHHRCIKKRGQQAVLPLQICFEKIQEVHGVQMRVPCYKVHTLNARKNCLYHLISLDLSGKYEHHGQYIVKDDGELKLPDEEGSYLAILHGYQPAERVKYFLVSEDKQQQAETVIIPWPIEKKNAYGHTIRVELISSSYSAFTVLADGYYPGEPIRALTYVDGKVIEAKGNASRQGTFSYLLMPAMKSNKEGGFLTFAIETAHSTNSIKLPWGLEFRKKGEVFIKRKYEEFAELSENWKR